MSIKTNDPRIKSGTKRYELLKKLGAEIEYIETQTTYTGEIIKVDPIVLSEASAQLTKEFLENNEKNNIARIGASELYVGNYPNCHTLTKKRR